MNLKIPADLQDYVEQEVRSGRYGSEGEVIAAALRQMRERTERRPPAQLQQETERLESLLNRTQI